MPGRGRFRASFHRFIDATGAYLRNSGDETMINNFTMIRRASTVALALMVAHIPSVVFELHSVWKIAVLLVLFTLHAGLTYVVWRYEDSACKAADKVSRLRIALMLLIYSYTLYISVFLYPDRPAIFYSGVFLIVPALFVLPLWRMAAWMGGVTAAQIVLSLLFKSDTVAMWDVATALVDLLFGVGVSVLVLDVRVREYSVRSQLQVLGTTDGLTRLTNKISTEQLCSAYLATEGQRSGCTLMMIDVDNFKLVNDGAGHQAGDRVLSEIGEILRGLFRGNDVLGRIGGDEFLVLMRGTDDEDLVTDRAAQLEQKVAGIPVVANGKRIDISCSVGVALKRKDQRTTYEQMFALADGAMYKAKQAGKARVALQRCQQEGIRVIRRMLIIADDDAINRALIRNVFEEKYEILEAENGVEAMELMRQHGFRVASLLLDIGMPVMDGYQVLEQMHQEKKISGIPVVVITGDRENELRALSLGATDMVSKPLDPQVLRVRVDNAIRHSNA